MTSLIAGCVVGFMMVIAYNLQAATTEVFHYRDEQGVAVFVDHAMSAPEYKLIWRKSLARLDAFFERPPHLPITNADESNTTSASTQHQPKRGNLWRRRTRFTPMIAKVAKSVRLDANLIHAVVQAESGYNPNARSPAGARGLMQLMPATAKRYGVKIISDPEQNLLGGANYLRDLLELFDNDLRLVLAAYNAGEGAVLKYGNKIPPFSETKEYVRRVIANLRSLRKQNRGGTPPHLH